MISISVKPAARQIKKFYYLQARLSSICFPASFTSWSAQLKISMRSAQNLCQIPVQVTRKHTLALSPAKEITPHNPYTFTERFKGTGSKFTPVTVTALAAVKPGKAKHAGHNISFLQHKHLAKGVFYGEGGTEESRGREGSSSSSINLAAPTQRSPSIHHQGQHNPPANRQEGGQETILNQLLPNRPSNYSQPFRTWQPNLNFKPTKIISTQNPKRNTTPKTYLHLKCLFQLHILNVFNSSGG